MRGNQLRCRGTDFWIAVPQSVRQDRGVGVEGDRTVCRRAWRWPITAGHKQQGGGEHGEVESASWHCQYLDQLQRRVKREGGFGVDTLFERP